ncbi:MAG: acetoacetyl-CoA synthetase [Acidimicrobiaceae bacterium]
MDAALEVLWTPPPDVRDRSNIGRYLTWLEAERGLRFQGYADLWRWSVDDLEGFWSSIWDHFDVVSHTPYERVLADRKMPGATWFSGATLNYAEHALRSRGAGSAVVSRSQTRPPVDLEWDELRDQVSRARAGLARAGVGRGDRVAAYLPNIAETLVAFLATASLGAVWSSCAPEFGTRSVIDRFQQIDPVVLLTVDGYRYGDRDVDRSEEIAVIRSALPSLRATVVLPYLGDGTNVPGAVRWDDLIAEAAPLEFEPVPFDHPLYILYSSGTTGLPKPIVHGHGGILLEHLKMLALHHDLGPDDRFFWFSTTGWMMWNYLVSGLVLGSAVVLFDGNPAHPDLGALWRLAAEVGITSFGTSAPFLLACRKEGLDPAGEVDLSAIRGVGSTGAPLPAEGFRWVYEHVGRDLLLSSASGGTDVCTAFVAAVPLLPVVAGEIPCRCLGAKIEAFDEDGRAVIGRQGELVITEPMPSMPVGFWDDPDGSRYRDAYFDAYPGVWRHGDWITITERGSCTITGRSDSTLNRGGVRLGTADFYSVVEGFAEVADSLVVHLEDPEGGVGELLLFLQLQPGCALDDDLRSRIATELRTTLSPRHVPDEIRVVEAVPRTLSGKKLEIPVKRILTGTPAEVAASKGALADPGSLAPFEALAAERAEP